MAHLRWQWRWIVGKRRRGVIGVTKTIDSAPEVARLGGGGVGSLGNGGVVSWGV